MVLERVREGRIMLELIKQKRNWLVYWLGRNCLLKNALGGILNRKKVRGTRRYQMIDNFTIDELYEDTKMNAKKRVERKRLSLQWKNYPSAEHCDWMIDMLQDSMFMCFNDWYAARLYVHVFEKVLTALVNEELSSDCSSFITFNKIYHTVINSFPIWALKKCRNRL